MINIHIELDLKIELLLLNYFMIPKHYFQNNKCKLFNNSKILLYMVLHSGIQILNHHHLIMIQLSFHVVFIPRNYLLIILLLFFYYFIFLLFYFFIILFFILI